MAGLWHCFTHIKHESLFTADTAFVLNSRKYLNIVGWLFHPNWFIVVSCTITRPIILYVNKIRLVESIFLQLKYWTILCQSLEVNNIHHGNLQLGCSCLKIGYLFLAGGPCLTIFPDWNCNFVVYLLMRHTCIHCLNSLLVKINCLSSNYCLSKYDLTYLF